MKSTRFFTPGLKIFVNIANVFFHLLMLAVSYVVLILYLRHAYCVVLPNGHMIGYSSILNPSPDGLFKMVLRDPTGKALVTTDYMMRFVRHPNDDQRVLARFPGNIELDLPGEELMPAVLYIHPYGAERVEPEYYSAAWTEISQSLSEDASFGWLGISLLYEKLELSKKFEIVNCGTPWFDSSD
ncbi:MAG: hypothetical protein AAF967_08895 [Pseudomonadota bacterium]